MEEVRQFTVKVAIDKFISVNLTVNAEMSALEFLGLTTKVNQLFKISNKVAEDRPRQQERNIVNYYRWSPELIALLKKVYPDTKSSDIVKMSEFKGLSQNKICSKAFALNLKKCKVQR